MTAKRQHPYKRAFDKGVEARDAGGRIEDCPYQDTRKPDGRLTWVRSWRRAWIQGWQHRNAELARR